MKEKFYVLLVKDGPMPREGSVVVVDGSNTKTYFRNIGYIEAPLQPNQKELKVKFNRDM